MCSSDLIYTREEHADLADGDLKQMNGCRIGATDGSYQKELLEKWLDSNQIQAEVVICKGYDEMIEKLDADELDALVVPALSVNSDFIAIANIGAGDCYFGVSKSRPDLLKELNSAMEEINNTETDYSSKLYARYEGKAVINYALNKEEKQWLDAHENTIRVGYLRIIFLFVVKKMGNSQEFLELFWILFRKNIKLRSRQFHVPRE